MHLILPALIALVICFLTTQLMADWSPQKAPLMTRWAKDVSPENVHVDYPRPQMVREKWMSLNGLWQFQHVAELGQPPVGKQLERQILVPFPPESALSGVMERGERMWYRREFEIPADWKGQSVLIHFGAVDWESDVYVNGQHLGQHRGGYDPFTYDITEALKPEGKQELLVAVFDPTDAGDQPRGKQVREPHGIWYTPTSGIWQTVWMEPVPAGNYIGNFTITTDFDSSTVRVDVGVARTTRNNYDPEVTIDVLDGDKVIATGKNRQPIKIANAKPWSHENPHLYNLRLRTDSDAVQSYFGMRKIEVKKDDKGFNRLFLNNEPVFHIGLLDQGFWPDGLYTAPTEEALRYDIEVTKQLGFNTIRKHVKVEPARWYYHADKLGVLVWQDMPNGNNKTDESRKQFELELRNVINALRNSPAIVMWVPFNEEWGQFDTERVVAMVQELDPTRLVNNASGWVDKGVGHVHDIHQYPGPAAPKVEEKRAGVLGEFGGLGLYIDGHHWTEKNFSYRGMQDAEQLTHEYRKLLGRVWTLRDDQGLAAAIYTQTTDVEGEINGLLTYDRELIKTDVEQIVAANTGNIPRTDVQVVVATSQQEPQTWRYTFDAPPEKWFAVGFDDSKWEQGPGGFGTEGTPGAIVRTTWNTPQIWIRREFELPAGVDAGELHLLMHHDEDAEVYLNGVLARRVKAHVSEYTEYRIRDEARAALKPGRNVIAIHCRQSTGGQYIDAGLARLVVRE